MSPVILLIALILFTYIIYDFATSKATKNSPPGPIRLPYVGSYLQLIWENYTFPHVSITNLVERYKSPVVSFYMGPFYFVVANTYDTIREIFHKPELQGRPDIFAARLRAYGERLGFFFHDGEDWLTQRRFSLRELRDFGFGRRSERLEDILNREISQLVELLREENDKGCGTLLPDVFYPTMLNSLLYIFTGNVFPKDEHEKLKNFGRKGLLFQRSADITGTLAYFPWVRYFIPKQSGYSGILESNSHLLDFITNMINNNQNNFDEEYLRGFLDSYMKSMKDYPQFSEKQLRLLCLDLMFPASTAVGTSLTFAMRELILQPHLQEKCQEQLDAVAGRGRLPTLDDRQYLPYVEATMREVLRYHTLTPLALPHTALEDSQLGGYDVPKNTVVVTNLYGLHHDKDLWGDPEVFRPERFLDSRGNLKKKDFSLPFGLGRRVCAGETLARQNMFLILSAILQNFTLEEHTSVKDTKILPGLIQNMDDNFRVKFVPRV